MTVTEIGLVGESVTRRYPANAFFLQVIEIKQFLDIFYPANPPAITRRYPAKLTKNALSAGSTTRARLENNRFSSRF